MRLKILKPFDWAHQHVTVKHYEPGEDDIQTDDEDLIKVSSEEGWTELVGEPSEKPSTQTAPTRADLDAALATLPGDQTDPDYVVRNMRAFFGDLFTSDDEDAVRSLFKPPQGKPSDGLKVDELKAALAAKAVAIPEGMTLKADLASLLDANA